MKATKRILVIDDDKSVAELTKTYLEREGWQVDLAYDGEEGLAKAKMLKPDLITLDVLMPKMNGYEVCEQLKSDPQYKHIPILMITVRADREDIAEGLIAGADDYITKPFERKDLASKVKDLLKAKA